MSRKSKEPAVPECTDVQVTSGMEDLPVSGRRKQGSTADTYSNRPEDPRQRTDRRSRISQFATSLPITPLEQDLFEVMGGHPPEEIIAEWTRLRWQIATAMVDNRPAS